MRKAHYKPIILVTGASSGVGRALAELFYHLPQYRTVVTVRRFSVASLRKDFEANDHFRIEELDVLNTKSRTRCMNNIRLVWGDIDILINNAGISYRSVVEHMSEEDENLQMQTNYFGPIALIKEIVSSMREKGRGKIINVSSVSGMLAMPTMASYSASKHALEGASEALWYEMKPFGINVSLIQPGFINSHSFQNVYYSKRSHPENIQENAPYSDYYQNMGPFIEKLMRLSTTTPQEVAEKILWVIQTENPPLWVPATPDAVLFYFLRRIIPRRWLMPILFFFLPKSQQWALRHTLRRDSIGYGNRERVKKDAA
jgi:short-subunit dehydrogenase